MEIALGRTPRLLAHAVAGSVRMNDELDGDVLINVLCSTVDIEMVAIAEVDGKVVGVACIIQLADHKEIGKLWVDPLYRGRGTGTLLVSALVEHGLSMGWEMYATCRKASASNAVNANAGMVLVGEHPTYNHCNLWRTP